VGTSGKEMKINLSDASFKECYIFVKRYVPFWVEKPRIIALYMI